MRRVGTKWKPAKTLSRMTREEMKAFNAEHRGDFIAIPIDGYFGFGRYIAESSFAFYDLKSDSLPPFEEIEARPVLFFFPSSVWRWLPGAGA